MHLDMINPKKHRQLFLDDFAVESMKSASRVPYTPQRNGVPLSTVRGFRAVPAHNGIRRKSYGNGGILDSTHTTRSRKTASTGKKPSLGLYESNGSKDNNIAFDPESKGPGRPYHVVRDETDPDPGRRYKGLVRCPQPPSCCVAGWI